jgi:hypothetical protein
VNRTSELDGPALERAAGVAVDLAGHFTGMAEGIDAAAGTFPGGTPAWRGQAARAVARVLAAHPRALGEVAAVARQAASALTDYAESLLVAAQLSRDAEFSPEPLASELRDRAGAMAGRGADDVSSRLLSLAASAPGREAPVVRAVEQVRADQAEAWLRVGESGQVAATWAVHLAGVIGRSFE